MSVHDPTRKPTLAKLEKGFKQFEEGFVILESKVRLEEIPVDLKNFYLALAIYRTILRDAQDKKAEAE